MNDERDFSATIEQHFPYDGPHTSDRVLAAAQGVSELIRYLNNATGPGNGSTSLAYAPTVYRLLSSLTASTSGMDQLLRQLTDALNRQADDPTLYDDRRGEHAGRDTAREAATSLDQARRELPTACSGIEAAWERASHLGHDL